MTVNLASKYSEKIASKFTKASYIQGNVNNDYNWDGVKTVTVYTPVTVDLSAYNREITANRFGTPQEMQDTIQRLELTKEPSFSIIIDKGNNSDQMLVKNAGKMMSLQIAEKMVPYMDKYAFEVWARRGGLSATLSAEPTKTNIVEEIMKGSTALDNALVPDDNRVVYLKASIYNALRLSPEFVGCDPLAVKGLEKGVVGTVAGMKVVKVPDNYFYNGVQFIIAQKRSVLAPTKIKTARILEDVAGIDGAVLEGRNYFDAFVLDARRDGVYVCSLATSRAAAPTVAISAHSCTITGAAGYTIYYTMDGTDPRDLDNPARKTYTAAFTTTAGTVVNAYQEKTDGLLPSQVASKTDA